ncbi:hypothetical protein ACQPZF_17270 [Actinosynnema sp. CS-041913]|uniref:hypothetical protein n=1 Tax=Actinosynnema sp. CS-041913 TaxID=3239917 RepID=UPI003D8FE81B
MDRTVTVELLIGPRSEEVQLRLRDAVGWQAYADELTALLGAAVRATGAAVFEVDQLLLNEPVPGDLTWLRNGVTVDPATAVALVVDMAGGKPPPFALVADGFRVDTSWDGFVHMGMSEGLAEELGDVDGDEVIVVWRPWDVSRDPVVERVADGEFWAEVRAAARARLVLLREQWAHGRLGTRWYLVDAGNVDDVIAGMGRRSLVGVVVDPDLRLDPTLVEKPFTAFPGPLVPGRLDHVMYGSGVDDVSEVTGAGLSYMVPDSIVDAWCAVVPDADGVVRIEWEDNHRSIWTR